MSKIDVLVEDFLAQKRIRFKGDSPRARLLVEQLRDFPNGDHDDGPDALEMAIRLARDLFPTKVAQIASRPDPPPRIPWGRPY